MQRAHQSSVHTHQQLLEEMFGACLPSAMEDVQAVQCQEKLPVRLPKAVLETGVFSVLGLTN